MKSWLKFPFRVTGRLLWLIGEFFRAAIGYVTNCAFQPRQPQAKAAWLQCSAKRVLRIFGVKTDAVGTIPMRGMLVCNHLSYLDVLVLAALTPSVFVAKSEVRQWPVFGWFARLAGTIFVVRSKPSRTAQSAEEIEAALRNGSLVVLFPEGTSSGGETVLPFKSSLLEAAARQSYLITAGLISYELTPGDVTEEVCYWKDMTLVPHLINLLSKDAIKAKVVFTEVQKGSRNRKELARQLHSEVLRLRKALAA